VGQRKKSRVAEPRVIFRVPTSENNFLRHSRHLRSNIITADFHPHQ
jgi:hypothetical protein